MNKENDTFYAKLFTYRNVLLLIIHREQHVFL